MSDVNQDSDKLSDEDRFKKEITFGFILATIGMFLLIIGLRMIGY